MLVIAVHQLGTCVAVGRVREHYDLMNALKCGPTLLGFELRVPVNISTFVRDTGLVEFPVNA